jgi:hypothetical protein
MTQPWQILHCKHNWKSNWHTSKCKDTKKVMMTMVKAITAKKKALQLITTTVRMMKQLS